MKLQNVALLIALAGALASCKKDKYPIVGKWQQIKLRTYTQSYAGVISNDTTFQSASFNSSNYVQFNNDGTCIIGIFYPPGSIDPRSTAAYASTAKYDYAPTGNQYVMTQPTTLIYPSGFITTDTASLNNNTVLIHQVFNSHINYTVSDAYYSK